MKVAYVCADLGIPVFGEKGASIHVQEIIRALLQRGDQVSLFAAKLGGQIPDDFHDVEVFSVDASCKTDGKHESSVEQREKYAQNVADMLLEEMRRHDDFDLVYERYSLWSTVGLRYGEERRIACITEVNSPLILEQMTHRRLNDVSLAREIEQQVLARSSSIIAVSQEVARYLETACAEIAPVTVIANGVNTQRFSSIEVAGKKGYPDLVSIGFVGTLKPWHGVGQLIHAFASVHCERPNTRLIIIGDGPMRQSLMQLADELEVSEFIDWIGSVTAVSVPEWVARFDIAVAPYPRLDRFYFSPLKLFEYMAGGVPVVASRIGQISDFVEDGLDGYLVDAGDIEQLADALQTLVDDPELRERFGRRGREKALQNFDWNNVLERILATVTLTGDIPEQQQRIDYVSSSQER